MNWKLLTIVIACLGIGMVIAANLITNTQQIQQGLQPSSTETTTLPSGSVVSTTTSDVSTSTAPFKTYSNPQAGLSFQYPATFTVVPKVGSNGDSEVKISAPAIYPAKFQAPGILMLVGSSAQAVSFCSSNTPSAILIQAIVPILAAGGGTPVLGTQTIGGIQFKTASETYSVAGTFGSLKIAMASSGGICRVIESEISGTDPATEGKGAGQFSSALPASAVPVAAQFTALISSIQFSASAH